MRLNRFLAPFWLPSGLHIPSNTYKTRCIVNISLVNLICAPLWPELKMGQYVTSQVEEIKNDGRLLRLSVSPSTIAQACAEPQHGWNLTNLLPGLMVKATIKKVESSYLSNDILYYDEMITSSVQVNGK